jgi:hypothetical protein
MALTCGPGALRRPVLLGIGAVVAALFAWNITQAGIAPFYAVAVKRTPLQPRRPGSA